MLSLLALTQAGGSVDVWLITFITDTSSNGHHPIPFSVAVHAGRRASLCFTVRDTCPSHGHQGSWLCTRRGSWVRGQVEACIWTAPVEDRHTHEGNASTTVNNGQNESEAKGARSIQTLRNKTTKNIRRLLWRHDYPLRVSGAKLRVLTLIRLYLLGWYWWGELGSTLEKLLSAAIVSIFTQPSLVSLSPLDGLSSDKTNRKIKKFSVLKTLFLLGRNIPQELQQNCRVETDFIFLNS